MPRYFLHLAYKGTGFHGWQAQPNAPTVQESLNKALRTLLREEVGTTGCGRTDAGVHSSSFVAHFDYTDVIADEERLVFQTNAILPLSIRVYRISRIHDEAHSRFDARRRAYSYYLHQQPDPFLTDYSWYFPRKLDLERMNQAAQLCAAHLDFTCFSKAGGQQQTNHCTIYHCLWRPTEKGLFLDVAANRFLRGMVRAMVGTMADVGLGKMTLESFHELLLTGSRSDAGQSVPPQGLFLEEVTYDYFPLERNYFLKR